jgi:hypothetical protein
MIELVKQIKLTDFKTFTRNRSPFSAMWILLLYLLGFGSLKAQVASGPIEVVSFHIPKTLYVVGEKIWFEAAVKSGQDPSPSQVLYAELVDRFSNSVIYTKVPLEQGKALNYLLLSSAVPSDHYLLRVYTRISPYLELNQGIAQQYVTVINPKIPPKNSSPSGLSDNRPIAQNQNVLRTSNSNPKPGESFRISASIDPTKILSSGISLANPYLGEEHRAISSDELYSSIETNDLLPELFGHIVEAKVPQPDTTKTYFLSLHGKQSALFTDRVDSNGQIRFDAGGLSHWDRLIIQLEDGAEMEGLEIITPVIKTKFKPELNFPTLSISQSDFPFLSQLQKASAVESYYVESFDLDSLEVVTGFVADHTYLLDDYTRFETVETVIREYVPSVAVRTRDKKKEFRLIDEAGNAVFDSNPLILVDAMPVFDSDLLSAFNPKFLSKLEVLNREFYLNDRTYPGVLSFSSYTNNFGLFPLAPSARFFDYLGLQPLIELEKNQFEKPATGGRFPDLRTILFWDRILDKEIQAPALDGRFLFWVKYLDEAGTVKVSRSFLNVAP